MRGREMSAVTFWNVFELIVADVIVGAAFVYAQDARVLRLIGTEQTSFCFAAFVYRDVMDFAVACVVVEDVLLLASK